MRTNWVGLIDEWATRFFHELDYEREAQNGMTFKEQMAGLEGIVVADVYQDLSNKEVLTTVWMEGMLPTLAHTCWFSWSCLCAVHKSHVPRVPCKQLRDRPAGLAWACFCLLPTNGGAQSYVAALRLAAAQAQPKLSSAQPS